MPQVFNVGQLRRSRAREKAKEGAKPNHSASYFSHDNKEATESREKLASDSLDMLIAWLKEGGNVGIHGIASCAYRSRALC
jgi:6-phosphofructo-2-kinase/fructose-2,6-biphosphatase 2